MVPSFSISRKPGDPPRWDMSTPLPRSQLALEAIKKVSAFAMAPFRRIVDAAEGFPKARRGGCESANRRALTNVSGAVAEPLRDRDRDAVRLQGCDAPVDAIAASRSEIHAQKTDFGVSVQSGRQWIAVEEPRVDLQVSSRCETDFRRGHRRELRQSFDPA